MKLNGAWLVPVSLLVVATPAFAGPRDAEAVLNRCGRPLGGDRTILDDSVSGGRRILSYERGTMYFDKVAATGWTFSYGSHKKQEHMNESEMSETMPCFKLAMADSLASAPLPHETTAKRLETTMKEHIRQVALGGIGLIVFCGIVIFAWPRSRPQPLYED